MNADLMITIALCLYVLMGSLAMAALAAKSIRDDQAKEVDAKRPAAVDGSAVERPRTTML